MKDNGDMLVLANHLKNIILLLRPHSEWFAVWRLLFCPRIFLLFKYFHFKDHGTTWPASLREEKWDNFQLRKLFSCPVPSLALICPKLPVLAEKDGYWISVKVAPSPLLRLISSQSLCLPLERLRPLSKSIPVKQKSQFMSGLRRRSRLHFCEVSDFVTF